MPRLLVILLCAGLVSATGCVSSMVDKAIDSAERNIQERWSDEWAPRLIDKVHLEMAGFKEGLLEKIDASTQEKLDRLQVSPAAHDVNKDGKLQLDESLNLLRQMKSANEQQGSPFSLWELLAAFAGVYGGGSLLKGGYRQVLSNKTGTGDGTQA